jgi:hypothetical protein
VVSGEFEYARKSAAIEKRAAFLKKAEGSSVEHFLNLEPELVRGSTSKVMVYPDPA